MIGCDESARLRCLPLILSVSLNAEGCDEAFLAIADMIDRRMPFTFGHSRAVAALTEVACKRAGLPAWGGEASGQV